MKKAHNWSITFDSDFTLESLPFIRDIGGSRVKTPVYYHDAATRLDSPHFIFQYTLSGLGGFRIQGEEFRLKPGEGFLCQSHDPNIAYFYPPEATEGYEFFFVCIWGNDTIFQDIVARFGYIHSLPLESVTIQLLKKYQQRTPDSQRLLNLGFAPRAKMATDLAAELIAASETIAPKRGHELIEMVKTLLLENIEIRYSVNDLAKIVGLSRGHFNKIFKDELGINPSVYINNQRMDYAARLLKTTHLTVNEIAYKMGYDLTGNFVRSFKQSKGLPPGAYRASL